MKTLFVGRGTSASCLYRAALPSSYIEDTEWVGLGGDPTKHVVYGGSIEDLSDDFDCYVLQQVKGPEWTTWIKDRQDEGKKVIYEIDDFIHGVRKIEDHRFKKGYSKKAVIQHVDCMKICDALICSTEFLSDQYKKYNPNVYTCLNGIDTERYDLQLPLRAHTVVGWSGGTGHHKAVGPWLQQVSEAMHTTEDLAFASIGTKYAEALEPYHPKRCLSVPWVSAENYPHVIASNIDIMIAPAHDSKYFRSKSDLRWLEASAIGIPTIANPITYGSSGNPVPGPSQDIVLCDTPDEFLGQLLLLTGDIELRESIGQNAQNYVREYRDISVTALAWREVISDVCQG